AGFRVAEVPISFGARARGDSKMGLRIALEAAWKVPALAIEALRERLRASGRMEAYRRIAFWWLASRALVLGGAPTGRAVGWHGPTWSPTLPHEPFALLRAWDGRWYHMVAERGYLLVPGHQSDPAFFPLLPALMNVLHAMGIPLVAGGIVFVNL